MGKPSIFDPGLNAIVTGIVLACLATASAQARQGYGDGDFRDRKELYGIIESMPQGGMHGAWIVGGQSITTNRTTGFDQTEGALTVGRCAKVKWRNGHVHEIDSEPMQDCR